jgi:hypothetical protein
MCAQIPISCTRDPQQPEKRSTLWTTAQQNCPNNENTQHLQIRLDLPVPAGCEDIYVHKLYPDLRRSFLKSFNKDLRFQMSVEQSEAVWHMQGLVTWKAEVHLRLRNARQRVRQLFFGCNSKLALHPDVHRAFKNMLTNNLSVKLDAVPLSAEETSWWTLETLREQPPSAAATSTRSHGPSIWAFNRHSGGPHTCAGGCCPPGASFLASGASRVPGLLWPPFHASRRRIVALRTSDGPGRGPRRPRPRRRATPRRRLQPRQPRVWALQPRPPPRPGPGLHHYH